MLAQKIYFKNSSFLGGYIDLCKDYEDRSYITLYMTAFNDSKREKISMMVFKKVGFGSKKYDNPSIQILKDAFAQKLPVAVVFHENDSGTNILDFCYTNFTIGKTTNYDTPPDDFVELEDTGDLPFEV